jgi:hypothetical protein
MLTGSATTIRVNSAAATSSSFVARVDRSVRASTGVQPMIGVVVRFDLGDRFDEQAVRNIAETARAKFDGMPHLRSKAFTCNPAKREALNFYVWDSEEPAKAFFTGPLLDRVTGLYGVRPTVEFVQMATLVENTAT